MPHDHTLVVFGATGDLTGRLLLPALARLWQSGELTDGFRFVGAGPQSWDQDAFRDHARSRLASHAPDLPLAERESLLDRLEYRQVDVLDPSGIARLQDVWAGPGPTTLYLALPTHLLAQTVAGLAGQRLPPHVQVAVEKPFGADSAGAVALNAALSRAVPLATNVFRVDHVLGMDSVAELPRTMTQLRSADLAAGSDIEEISILWEETLALEGRAAFYDGAGALKDLLQNHLVQILCMVIMDGSAPTAGQNLSDRRLEALRTVVVPSTEQAQQASHRARYSAGRLASTGGAQGEVVPDYSQELGVDPDRNTETLAEVVLEVSGPQWAGTRFVLRAGKALGHRRRGVGVRFRRAPGTVGRADVWIDVDSPGTPGSASARDGGPSPAPLEQIAYTNVLRGLLSGSHDLSVSAEETETAWRLFTPVLQAWAAGTVPLQDYPAGTVHLPSGFGAPTDPAR